MTDIEINVQKIDPDIALLNIHGPLDGTTSDKLSETLDGLIAQKIYRFIIDLSDVKYIGSPGIGSFIGLVDILQENKGTIVFIYPNPNVKTTFKMFRLSAFFSIARDKETAFKEIKELCR